MDGLNDNEFESLDAEFGHLSDDEFSDLEAEFEKPRAAPGSVSEILGSMASQADPYGGSSEDFGSQILGDSLKSQEDAIASTEQSKEIGLNMLGAGAAIAAPAALGARAAVTGGMKAVPRLLQYGKEGLAASGGAELVDQGAKAFGLRERDSLGGEAFNTATDVALDMAVPEGIQLAGKAAKGIGKGALWMANLLVDVDASPQRVARVAGATNQMMDPGMQAKYLPEVISRLEKDRPNIYKGMAKTIKDHDASFNFLNGTREKVGNEIQSFYKRFGNVAISKKAIESSPTYNQVLDVATAPRDVLPKEQRLAEKALNDLSSMMEGGGDLDIARLWTIRKNLDSGIYTTLNTPPKTKEFLQKTRTAVSELIDEGLGKTGSQNVEILHRMNQDYKDLSNLTFAARMRARAKGGRSGPKFLTSPIDTAGRVAEDNPFLTGMAMRGRGMREGIPSVGMAPSTVQAGQEMGTPNPLDLFAPEEPQAPVQDITQLPPDSLNLMAEQGLPPEQEPFQGGLPRDTAMWNEDAIEHLLMATSQPNIAAGEGVEGEPEMQAHPIVLELVREIHKGLKSGDKDKVTRLVSDIAKIFPEHFEPGTGVDGRLFDPEEQSKYMSKIEDGVRGGFIESSFLAEQRDAFLNQNNQRVLPLHGINQIK